MKKVFVLLLLLTSFTFISCEEVMIESIYSIQLKNMETSNLPSLTIVDKYMKSKLGSEYFGEGKYIIIKGESEQENDAQAIAKWKELSQKLNPKEINSQIVGTFTYGMCKATDTSTTESGWLSDTVTFVGTKK